MTGTDAGCGLAESGFAKMGDRGIRIWLRTRLHHPRERLKVRRTTMSNVPLLMCHPLHLRRTPIVASKGILQQAHHQRRFLSSELHDPTGFQCCQPANQSGGHQRSYTTGSSSPPNRSPEFTTPDWKCLITTPLTSLTMAVLSNRDERSNHKFPRHSDVC